MIDGFKTTLKALFVIFLFIAIVTPFASFFGIGVAGFISALAILAVAVALVMLCKFVFEKIDLIDVSKFKKAA